MTTGSIRVAMTSDVGLRRKNNQDRKPWTPLVTAALDAGGTDNITVIVADMPLTEPEHHAFSAFRLDEGEDIGAIEDATLQTLRTIRSA